MKPQDHSDDETQNMPMNVFAEFELDTYQALLRDRVVLFNDDVTKNVIERVVLPLTSLSQKSRKPIKFLINSPGGSVENGQMVVDSILTSRAPIVTIALGEAMSR
jgi:ATP-dependent Clp protease protease subunit